MGTRKYFILTCKECHKPYNEFTYSESFTKPVCPDCKRLPAQEILVLIKWEQKNDKTQLREVPKKDSNR